MLNPEQLLEHVVRPSLRDIGLWSPEAERLVMATGAVESDLTYIHQIKGPALGLWQMEPATHLDIWGNFLSHRTKLADAIVATTGVIRAPGSAPDEDALIFNLKYGAAMCRVHYLRVPTPLPGPNDLNGQAAYWKAHYNTHHGRGTVEHFTAAASRLAMTWGNFV